MPELPEVETIKNALQNICVNTIIIASDIYTYKLRYKVLPNLSNIITSQKIISVERRAKYIILTLSNGHLILHLGMAGKIYITQRYQKYSHEHMTIHLNNHFTISFCDHRRFGAIIWTNNLLKEHPLIKNLGIEPFSRMFQVEYLYKKCLARKVSIKTLFMEGKVVSGIGNIYANEILFYSNIMPDRRTNSISFQECKQIYKFIKIVLNKAIEAGGTSIRDYRTPNNKLGNFTKQLLIYGRNGQDCLKCNGIVMKMTQNNRSTYYCSKCQV